MTLSSSAIAAAGRVDAGCWAPSGTRQTTARTTNTNTARTRTDIYAMCEYTRYAYSWFPPALAADRPASRARVARIACRTYRVDRDLCQLGPVMPAPC